MVLKGKTSINDFKCRCTDNFNNASLNANFVKGTNFIEFSKADFLIKVKSLDCKNKFLNEDICESLKAEKYPNIHVELLSASPLHNEDKLQLNRIYKYQIHANISIAGKNRQQNLDVNLKKTNENQYSISSDKRILMSEYNIEPKSPIRFIKISDDVEIQFNLFVQID